MAKLERTLTGDFDALLDYLHDGILADVAPTMLTLAGMAIPADMTGKCLLDQ